MFSHLAKKMLFVMAIIAFVGCVGAFVFFTDIAASVIYGILAGTLVSVFRFLFLERSLVKSLSKDSPARSRLYATFAFMIRTVLVIVALVYLALQHPVINLFGVIYGVLNMQAAAYICGVLVGKEARREAKKEAWRKNANEDAQKDAQNNQHTQNTDNTLLTAPLMASMLTNSDSSNRNSSENNDTTTYESYDINNSNYSYSDDSSSYSD